MLGRPKDKELSRVIAKLKATPAFTARQAIALGVSRRTLMRLVEKGEFLSRSAGVFISPSAKVVDGEAVLTDFYAACAKFQPPCFIGGLTALDYYDLTDSSPSKIWVMVPQNIQSTQKLYRLIRTKDDLEIGVVKTKQFRVSSIERALIDALRYSYIWGKPTAMFAIRKALLEGMTTYEAISKMATQLGYKKLFMRYADIISPEALGLQ